MSVRIRSIAADIPLVLSSGITEVVVYNNWWDQY